jgi:TRAP-type C4-dicarboxylate transport system permease small subunit
MSSRQPRPFRRATRRRVYLAMMGACHLLIILAWTVIYRYSAVAAIAMSAVALVVPPFAAIIANAGDDSSRR